MLSLNIIVAYDETHGIGKNNKIPWQPCFSEDLKHFKNTTQNSILIMGSRTYQSIDNKHSILHNRMCFVLSSTYEKINIDINYEWSKFHMVNNYDDVITYCKTKLKDVNIFIIGGKTLYEKALYDINLKRIYATKINGIYNCDVHVKEFSNVIDYRCELVEKQIKDGFVICTYEVFSEEAKYLKCLKNVLNNGISKSDRTGVGTMSIFSEHLKFSLKDNTLPLLTTKKTYWKGILAELIWFLSGNTDANILKEQGVKIWDGNGSKEFLTSLGFPDREEGDLGPVYGFQWRHWGANYKDKNTNYEGKGIDQIQKLIDTIKTNPHDRRLIISGWNVSDLHLMALPPCHLLSQFYVNSDTKELSCQLYQRSADMFLGVPFNIASYATLTHLIAHFTGLKASMLYISFGDTHIYNNHENAVRKQLSRNEYEFPKIKINPDTTLVNLKYSDIELLNYVSHDPIYAPMAV